MSTDDERRRMDLRQILKAWATGDADKMHTIMLSAFLHEFGKAPEPEPGPPYHGKLVEE